MSITAYDDSTEAYDDQQEIIDGLLTALKAITQIEDPKSGDRGPIKFARHIALCAIDTANEAANVEAVA